MATNEILQFAETDTGTNLLTQAEYAADSQRPIGNQPGVARSKLVNKALRQASLIAAGLAEFLADNQATDITDDLTPQNIADYLLAALQGGLGVTAPQFDNDTSLATTAFVQRALGNRRGYREITGATTLTDADAGYVIVCSGTYPYTVALPAPADHPGISFLFNVWQTSSNPVTLTTPAGGFDGGGSGGASFAIRGSANVTITSNGFNWVIESGHGGASLSSNGYQKLPSGLIIQWGLIYPPNTSIQTASFPVAFPNRCLSIAGSFTHPTPTYVNSQVTFQDTVSMTTGTFKYIVAIANQFSWIAIGY